MKYFLLWLTAKLPCRIIGDDAPYLERYYLMTVFGIRLYIHRFVGSDPDRGLHDHPFSWAISLILSGWYFEQTRRGVKRFRWINFLTSDSFHRVILPRDASADMCRPTPWHKLPTECWSLFIHRADRAKRWGFWHPLPSGDAFTPGQPASDEWRIMARDGAYFEPFVYPGGKTTSGEWWKMAPTGHQVRINAAMRREARKTG